MELNKREIVDVNGIKSYFFSNLAQYVTANDELLLNSPQEANGFASFVMGATKELPREEDIQALIAPDNGPAGVLAAGLDAYFILGKELTAPFQKAVTKLSELGFTHELVSVINDEKKLAGLIRENKLKKTEEAKILQTVLKIRTAEDNEQRFEEISDLCAMDLDFDAFTLIKLFKLEEVSKIRIKDILGKLTASLERGSAMKAFFLREFFTSLVDEIAELLLGPFDQDALTKIVQIIVNKFTEATEEFEITFVHDYTLNKLVLILERHFQQTDTNLLLRFPNLRPLVSASSIPPASPTDSVDAKYYDSDQ